MTNLRTGICVSVAVLALLTACGKKDNAADGMASASAQASTGGAAVATATGGGPNLKAGLWEMATKVEGMPQNIVTKMCMDDTLSAAFATKMGPIQQGDTNCSQTDVKRNGNVIDMTAVCTQGAQKINTQVRIEMQGENNYRQTINATFDPPTAGRNSVSTTVDGKWLGACSADMKPGDMVMPGGMKVNMYDAMKAK